MPPFLFVVRLFVGLPFFFFFSGYWQLKTHLLYSKKSVLKATCMHVSKSQKPKETPSSRVTYRDKRARSLIDSFFRPTFRRYGVVS